MLPTPTGYIRACLHLNTSQSVPENTMSIHLEKPRQNETTQKHSRTVLCDQQQKVQEDRNTQRLQTGIKRQMYSLHVRLKIQMTVNATHFLSLKTVELGLGLEM